MKKLIIVFSALLATFFGVWIYQAKNPTDNRPDEKQVELNNNMWWDSQELPVADPAWVLDPEIPANCIPLPGEAEIYMIISEDGHIQDYAQRVKQEDGSWLWEYGINPNIPDDYEAVEGIENVYKVIMEDGTVAYKKYIRNEDDTFAFVDVDENGNEIVEVESDVIPENFVRIIGNVYGIYNEHGVCIGYKERCYNEETQTYYWIEAEKPEIPDEQTQSGGNASSGNNGGSNSSGGGGGGNYGGGGTGGGNYGGGGVSSGGNYEMVESYTTTELSGDWIITYQTTVTKVYNAQGMIVSTKKDGPTEIGRQPASSSGMSNVPDPSKVAGTLSEEYARVSVGLNFNQELAKEVLTLINQERIAAGKPALVFNTSSEAYQLAATRAADMAIYNHSDFSSPMYGTLTDMTAKFGVSATNSYERLWKCLSTKSAEDIAKRLLLLDSGCLTSNDFTGFGLAIVSKGGYYYVNLVLLG